MKPFSYLSIMRVIGFLPVLVLFTNCKKDPVSTNDLQTHPSGAMMRPGIESLALTGLSQTSTGNVFNNMVPPTQWLQASAQYFSADDNLYAISKKLSRAHSSIPIVLQDFRFNIPSNAIIDNIVVSARRFKTGRGSLADHAVHLVTRRDPPIARGYFGVIFLNSNLIPGIETEISYTQNGADNNGGLPDEFGNYEEYQWTPGMINDPAFGVWFSHGIPNGSLVVYYDQVKITVYYSLP